MEDLKIPAEKQSDIVAGVKHLLAMARAGKIAAIGYAAVSVDDGDLVSGTNAVFTDERVVKDALKESIQILYGRVFKETKPLILVQ